MRGLARNVKVKEQMSGNREKREDIGKRRVTESQGEREEDESDRWKCKGKKEQDEEREKTTGSESFSHRKCPKGTDGNVAGCRFAQAKEAAPA
jgi:hypothetical protein